MRIRSISSFSSINSIIFYKYPTKLIPSDTSINISNSESISKFWYRSSEFRRKGSDAEIDNIDFLEYNFRFDPEKFKFNNNFIAEYWGDTTKTLAGINSTDIEKLDNLIFPSIVTNYEEDVYDSRYDYKLFRTVTDINGNQLIVLDIPENVYKLELYEDVIPYHNSSGYYEYDARLHDGFSNATGSINLTPSVIIEFGPKYLCKNNPSNKYWDTDINKNPAKRTVVLSETEYTKSLNEITSEKLLWLVISQGELTAKLNLSKRAWLDNENKLRNKNKYVLRNDSYYGLKDNNISQFETIKNTNLVYEKTTDLLVGTEEVNTPIIFNKKKLLGDVPKYNSCVSYMKGDIVTVNDTKYESLENNNIGNYPILSSSWGVNSSITENFRNKIDIVTNPVGSVETSISYVVINNNISNYPVTIELSNCLPEYSIDKDKLKITSMSSSSNYIYNTEYNTNTGKTTYILKVYNWSPLMNSKKLEICPELVGINIKLRLLYKGEYYSLSNKSSLEVLNQYINYSNIIFMKCKDVSNLTKDIEGNLISNWNPDSIYTFDDDNNPIVNLEFSKSYKELENYSLGINLSRILNNAQTVDKDNRLYNIPFYLKSLTSIKSFGGEKVTEIMETNDNGLDTFEDHPWNTNKKRTFSTCEYIIEVDLIKYISEVYADRVKYEISDVLLETEYENTYKVEFYSIGTDNFKEVTIKADGYKDIVLTLTDNSKKLEKIGGDGKYESIFTLTKDSVNEIYTITCDKAYNNCSIFIN